MPLDIPYGTETAGETIVIDGRIYRPVLVDSSGHPQVDVLSSSLPVGAARDIRRHPRSAGIDLTVSVDTDVDVVSYASGRRARILSVGLTGILAGRADVGFELYSYSSNGTKVALSHQYSGRVDWLRAAENPLQDLTTGFVPNIYHVHRYVAANDWQLRILFSPPAEASFGFGVRLKNGVGVPVRFYMAVIYDDDS